MSDPVAETPSMLVKHRGLAIAGEQRLRFVTRPDRSSRA
jgi:hypothetical protein